MKTYRLIFLPWILEATKIIVETHFTVEIPRAWRMKVYRRVRRSSLRVALTDVGFDDHWAEIRERKGVPETLLLEARSDDTPAPVLLSITATQDVLENVEIITPQEAAEAAKLLRHAFAPSEGKAEYVERSEVIDDSLIADVIRGPNGELLDFLALDTRYRVEFVW